MTQIWPATDTFDVPHGASPILWGRTRLWSTNQTSYGYASRPGHLIAARVANGRIFASATAFIPQGQTNSDVVAFPCRFSYHQDGSATFLPYAFSSGIPDFGDFITAGIMARMQTDGTEVNSDPQAEAHLLHPSAYLFLQARRLGQDRLLLLKVQNGSAVTLRDIPTGSIDQGQGTYPDGSARYDPQQMRMVTENVGGSVRIVCYRAVVTNQGTSEVDVYGQVQDNNPGTLAGRGYWGIVLSSARLLPTGAEVAPTCRLFESRDNLGTAGEPYFRDLWQRAIPGSLREYRDISGLTGHSLMGCWAGDYAHRDGAQTTTGTVQRVGSEATIGIQPPAEFVDAQVGWVARQQAETSSNQRTSVRMRVLDTTQNIIREAGIFLRGSFQVHNGLLDLRSESFLGDHFNGFRTGYLLKALTRPGQPIVFLLTRVTQPANTPGVETILGDAQGLGIAVGSTLQLDFQARNENNGAVGLSVALNGNPVTWLPRNGATFANGVLEDGSSDRVVQGSLVGLFTRISGNTWQAGGHVRFDDWTRYDVAPPDPDNGGGSGSGNGGGNGGGGNGNSGSSDGPDPVVASIVVQGEAAGKTGTLVTPANWPVEMIPRRDGTQHEMETGHVLAHARHLRSRREWRVVATGISPIQRRQLRQFRSDHKGGEIPFDWVHPGNGRTFAVRFLGGSWAYGVQFASDGASRAEQFAFALQEVFED